MTVIHRITCPRNPDHRNHRWANQCADLNQAHDCVDPGHKCSCKPNAPGESAAATPPAEETPAWDGDMWAAHLAIVEMTGLRESLVLGPYQALTIASLLDFTRQNTEDEETKAQLAEMISFVIAPFEMTHLNGMPLSDILRKTIDAGVIVQGIG